jgi:hypothetical protein
MGHKPNASTYATSFGPPSPWQIASNMEMPGLTGIFQSAGMSATLVPIISAVDLPGFLLLHLPLHLPFRGISQTRRHLGTGGPCKGLIVTVSASKSIN